MLKVVFMGTPDFSVPCLELLIQQGYDISMVITQPDRPKGRGQKVQVTPVKECALTHQIPVCQPESIRTEQFILEMQQLAPDVIVVVAFGKILPEAILSLPILGCVNVHASLLPRYRGAAPLHWAIINGESETGVTTMLMDKGLDTGDMILQQTLPIGQNETVDLLHDRMAQTGALLLHQTLMQLEHGRARFIPQDHSQASYAPMLTKEHEQIDWRQSAETVHNLIRGLNPWPVAHTLLYSQRLKIWRSTILTAKQLQVQPGTVLHTGPEGIDVACGSGSIRLIEIQPQNGKRMLASEYIRGHIITLGEKLGC